MSHLKPNRLNFSDRPDKIHHVVKIDSRGAFQTIDSRIDSKSLTIGGESSGNRQSQMPKLQRLTNN